MEATSPSMRSSKLLSMVRFTSPGWTHEHLMGLWDTICLRENTLHTSLGADCSGTVLLGAFDMDIACI